MAAPRMHGTFVLENHRGEIVRSFHWERSRIHVVYRKDSRRIETVGSLKDFEKQNIPYDLLHSATPNQIRKSPFVMEGVGCIRWVERASRLSTGYELAPEAKLEAKRLWGWSFGIQLGMALVMTIAGLVTGHGSKIGEKSEHTVTLVPDDVVRKMRENESSPRALKPRARVVGPREAIPSRRSGPKKRVVVVPSGRKIDKRAPVPTRSSSRRASAKSSKTTVKGPRGGGYRSSARRGNGSNERTMNQIGALGALNAASARSRGGNGGRGGLNLQAAGTEPGSGAGGRGFGGFGNNGGGGRGKGGLGRGKSQGLANAMYGKALIAAPFADGAPGRGTGGYGTRGKAGGGAQGVGYGSTTIVGSWKGTGPKGDGPAGSGSGNGEAYGSVHGFNDGNDDLVVQGGLDRDQIAEVVLRNRGHITYCYELGLQKRPALSGRVTVRWEIGPGGRVETARIAHSSLDSSLVERCIVGKVKSWRFPKPHGGVNVSVTNPFVLRRLAQR